MPRTRAALRRARTAALAAVLGALLVPLVGLTPGPAYAAQRASQQAPLAVTIDSLTPSALTPRKDGPVTVTGTVTNTDDLPWLDVRIYPFASSTPMTTTAELAEAAQTDETVEVGDRITTDKVVIGDLQPGQTTSYTMLVPPADLPRDQPGVYWFGVHALGSGPDGDDGAADGRARTFLPLMRRKAAPVRAAVLVPLRAHVVRNPDGSVANLTAWQRLLSPTGRLGRALEAGTSTGGESLSWLVDPGLIDAVRQLADGNPPRNIAPTENTADDATGSATPTPSPSASAQPDAEPDAEADAQRAAVRALASSWLDAILPVLKRSEVLALPYGDLDLSAAAAHDPDVYDVARARSVALFHGLGITATQVNAPVHGVLSHDALTMTDSGTPMVLSDAALPEDLSPGTTDTGTTDTDTTDPDKTGTATPTLLSAGAWRVAVSSTAASSGGPGPDDPLAAVSLRQRVLAEAAVRALDPARPPLVVTLPERWHLVDPTGFVRGLAQSWLQLTGLGATIGGQIATPVDEKDLRYPASAAHEQLAEGRFKSADALIRTGRTLQRVLARNDTVAAEVTDEALTDLGYAARGGGNDVAASSRSWIETQLGQIRLQAPSGVTLSGASGRFAATVVNGLDQPVTVAIRALEDDPGIAISAPRSVQIAPSGRVTVLLNATGARAGVHNVLLQLVDPGGSHFGESVRVPIRAAHVSRIIWLFLAVGGALLFGAIAIRLARRVRASRRSDPPSRDAPTDRSEEQVHAGE